VATYKIKLEGKEYQAEVIDSGHGARVTVEGHSFEVSPAVLRTAAANSAPAAVSVAAAPPAAPKPHVSAIGSGSGSIHAPIPGVVTALCVKVGDKIEAGAVVLKLEAMKMENDINSAIAGEVKEITVSEGSEVKDGQLLAVVG